MSIKLYKPTTSGRRHTSVIHYAKLLDKNVKTPNRLLTSKANSAGRNSRGVITVRHRGGGFKNKLREIDFQQNRINIPAQIQTIEYDPGRTAFISLISYSDGAKRFMLTPDGLKVGDTIITSDKAPIKPGNRLPLHAMPVGTFVHNVEINPGAGGKIGRSAGNFATVQAVEGKYAILKMPSGELRKALSACWASIGQLSNPTWNKVRVGKAGRKRLMGWKPTVRGKAMNPVDHPHGGGEGKSPIGMKYPKTKWGKHALGVKTRKRKKYSNRVIIRRRK
ncbi:MAG: 50S ribosomal protein L2 [Candidatus Doudnabacteria bacterium RIFCSPHIGHO2_01_FULL_43_23]|uniref:Large ribosomal subunit protein uL2 n=1 Tax=Candidatus Doudnabacteria bacterium RIFCSPHIGHO2_01_FULL_43_23 TaxID=1817822 RepID=A0A1F5NVG1_9BACT|nr:ribosomal protein L2 [uncultured bacterium]OGE81651.1 MAG: 50S ribosomal protein L2 [Candidatus Doudnabacteria bacterium RIFCSPHIGHO2_01_FULL_43_23]